MFKKEDGVEIPDNLNFAQESDFRLESLSFNSLKLIEEYSEVIKDYIEKIKDEQSTINLACLSKDIRLLELQASRVNACIRLVTSQKKHKENCDVTRELLISSFGDIDDEEMKSNLKNALESMDK